MTISKFENLLYDDSQFLELRKRLKSKKRSIFNIIIKDSDELTFSRTLKYFLDPAEEHFLNDTFLKEFLYVLSIKSDNQVSRLYFDTLNLQDCKVYREFSAKEYGRIDVFIELKNEFALVIENKLYSEEGIEQTIRYEEWANSYLKNKYKRILLCFLTPDGKQAESNSFIALSINDIINIFNSNEVINQLNSNNKFLLENFNLWLEELKMTDKNLKKICQSIYKKYKVEIDFIVENAPTTTAFLKDILTLVNKKI
jgi:hypothetical protein